MQLQSRTVFVVVAAAVVVVLVVVVVVVVALMSVVDVDVETVQIVRVLAVFQSRVCPATNTPSGLLIRVCSSHTCTGLR